jgi:hypothetical protein
MATSTRSQYRKLLPKGLRSSLAYAVCADFPELVSTSLEACIEVGHVVLVTERGGKVGNKNDKQLPWCYEEAEQSSLKLVDNKLYEFCTSRLVNLPTVVLWVACMVGSVRTVDVMISNSKYKSQVDPGVSEDQAIRFAIDNDRVGVVKLLWRVSRVRRWLLDQLITYACRKNHFDLVEELLGDERFNPALKLGRKETPLSVASQCGRVKILKRLLKDERVDPSIDNNYALLLAVLGRHLGVVKVLLKDARVYPIRSIIETALKRAHIGILRLFLADGRVDITNDILACVDVARKCYTAAHYESCIEALFTAYAHPWPRVIGNDVACVAREYGYVRKKLDDLEEEGSWMLMLSVKRRFTPRVAARVGDVLREVCKEWTPYLCEELEAPEANDEDADGY